MDIDHPDHSRILTQGKLKLQIDQFSLYQKLCLESEELKSITIYHAAQNELEYLIKFNSTLLPIIQSALEKLSFTYLNLPQCYSYFATNISTSIPDELLTKILQSVYPCSSFNRLSKYPRCAFIHIPLTLIETNERLQAAQKSTNGIIIDLPSCPPIYLRPRRKKKRNHSLKSEIQYSNQINHQSFSQIVASNKNKSQSNQQQQMKIKMVSLEKRIADVETLNFKLQNQMESISSSMENKLSQIENSITNSNKSTNENIAQLVQQISLLTSNLAKTSSPIKNSEITQNQNKSNSKETLTQTPSSNTNSNQPSRSRSYTPTQKTNIPTQSTTNNLFQTGAALLEQTLTPKQRHNVIMHLKSKHPESFAFYNG